MTKQNKKSTNLSTQQTPHPEPHPPSSEMIERFLDLQQQELQLRTEELSMRSQQENNRKSIAESSITANLQDRNNERSHLERKSKILFCGATIIILIMVIFAGYALYSGKEAIVMKLVEVGAIFVAGFAGGYGYKASKRHNGQDIQD